MSEQELFDEIVANLLKQGKPSISDKGQCYYRGPEGLKCAVGWVISDNEYDENMEFKSVTDLLEGGQLPCSLTPHVKLLSRLQIAHDNWGEHKDTEVFKNVLKRIATERKLQYEPQGAHKRYHRGCARE